MNPSLEEIKAAIKAKTLLTINARKWWVHFNETSIWLTSNKKNGKVVLLTNEQIDHRYTIDKGILCYIQNVNKGFGTSQKTNYIPC